MPFLWTYSVDLGYTDQPPGLRTMKLHAFRLVPCSPVSFTGSGITVRADRRWSMAALAF